MATPKNPFHISLRRDPVQRERQIERIAMAAALELPRMSGDPAVIAHEIVTRGLAKASGFVYVSSYVRHAALPKKSRGHR